MDKKPFISVIILCYNQAHTIARTIDSVLKQETEYPFEIIIGEDASPNDNTRSICENYAVKYPNIIRLMPKEPNKGLLKNYSDCINECKGVYLAVCAGDDWWHNLDKLQLQVSFLENNEDYGLVFTDYRIVDIDIANENSKFLSSKPIAMNEEKTYENLLRGNFISAGTVVFRKSIFSRYVNLDQYRLLGFLMEDYPMWLEMIQHTKFKYFPIETMTYTIAEGSISNNKTDFRKTEKFENSVLDIKKYYINKYPIENINIKKLFELHHHHLTNAFVRDKHFERAKYYSRFLINEGIKGKIKYIICHTPLIRVYAKYLKLSNNG